MRQVDVQRCGGDRGHAGGDHGRHPHLTEANKRDERSEHHEVSEDVAEATNDGGHSDDQHRTPLPPPDRRRGSCAQRKQPEDLLRPIQRAVRVCDEHVEAKREPDRCSAHRDREGAPLDGVPQRADSHRCDAGKQHEDERFHEPIGPPIAPLSEWTADEERVLPVELIGQRRSRTDPGHARRDHAQEALCTRGGSELEAGEVEPSDREQRVGATRDVPKTDVTAHHEGDRQGSE